MTTTCHAHSWSSPAGRFSVAVNDAGAVVATAFGDIATLSSCLSADANIVTGREATRLTAVAREQLQEYFHGARQQFELPLAASGSTFQQRVWKALRQIPYGDTTSYGALAKRLASSARAVGRANATNPICVIVPCHRVNGADGSLTGFAFGLDAKRWLLALEQNRITRSDSRTTPAPR